VESKGKKKREKRGERVEKEKEAKINYNCSLLFL
jgi:hypothetical protein